MNLKKNKRKSKIFVELLDSSWRFERWWMDSSLFREEFERFFDIVRRTWAICFFKLATCFERGSLDFQKENNFKIRIILFEHFYRSFEILSIVLIELLSDLRMYDQDLNIKDWFILFFRNRNYFNRTIGTRFFFMITSFRIISCRFINSTSLFEQR